MFVSSKIYVASKVIIRRGDPGRWLAHENKTLVEELRALMSNWILASALAAEEAMKIKQGV